MQAIPDDEIPKFLVPEHWMRFFPGLAVDDLRQLGLFTDWRRTFTTTDLSPFYDAFIRWQFNHLHRQGDKLLFGKRYTIWSPLNGQPCMDHERASGEQVKPNEYTGIKLRAIGPFKEDHPFTPVAAGGRTIFLIAATMRPETMVGQTNCWVHPDGNYGIFASGKADEAFVFTDRAALNLAFQSNEQAGLVFTPEFGKVQKLGSVTGRQLIGLPVAAPNSPFEQVRVLPMMTVLMDVGTGIVTSVPSDSPADYAALRDLKRKPDMRTAFNVEEEWLLDPVPIIRIPSMGDTTLAAPETVEKMGINSQNDPRLEEAKDIVYQNGFGKGIMIVGEFAGQQVSAIKNAARQALISANLAFPYAEPASPVISRSGDECVVCLADQWYFTYGTEAWRERARLSIRAMNTFGEENRQGLERALDFINGWPVSRTYGMGSRIPWQPEFLIESLSDSTIYNAFYTVASKLHGRNNMFGTEPNAAGVTPAQMTDAVWDYIFLNGPYPASEPNVPAESVLQEMRREFQFWFPTDMRVSGRDLQGNHLIFYVYNNVALFPEHQWPGGIRCNGFVLLDGEKMSKSKGNFLSLNEGLEKFGADALRWTLASAGDGLEDANIETKFANKTILRLHQLVEWFQEVRQATLRDGELTFRDLVFEAQIDNFLKEAYAAYESTNYRAVSTWLFDILTARDNYRLSTANVGMHRQTLQRFLEVFTIALSPICPHTAEYLWQVINGRDASQLRRLAPADSILNQRWPAPAGKVDPLYLTIEDYILNQRAECIRLHNVACTTAARSKKPTPTQCTIFIAKTLPEWQETTIERLKEFVAANGSFPDIKQFAPLMKTHPHAQKKNGLQEIMAFVKQMSEDYSNRGPAAFVMTLPFDELDTMTQNLHFMRPPKLPEAFTFHIAAAEESEVPKAKSAKPGKPAYHFT